MTTEERINDLELRLDQYHSWLTDAVDQRDRLSLDAAWGVHGALWSTLAVLAILYAWDRYVGWDTWWTLALGLVIFAAEMATRMWSNGGRMEEVDRQAKLPTWEARLY